MIIEREMVLEPVVTRFSLGITVHNPDVVVQLEIVIDPFPHARVRTPVARDEAQVPESTTKEIGLPETFRSRELTSVD